MQRGLKPLFSFLFFQKMYNSPEKRKNMLATEKAINTLNTISNIRLQISLLPWESFYKKNFTLQAVLKESHLFYAIDKNEFSYLYFVDSLFYEEERTCLLKNLLNFFQKLTISNPKYPYACPTSLVDKNFFLELEKVGLIQILYIDESIYFNKLRSFEENDLFFLAHLFEEYNIDFTQFKIVEKESKLLLEQTKKFTLKELKNIKERSKKKKTELEKIKQHFKEYLLAEEKNLPTLSLKVVKRKEQL